ncbi:hypothetical protein SAMN06272735_8293 [Streptomyces sp. TLI_55]|uniref:hypothetical protein n=1 Tax=Streptomyces sp. TLI_55 TaxID=1938861 RepID=UPI000BDD8E21|nr:hypothetical protein [Streptomyces sp. TLI_55]SNX66428.1 hypothetical protein SAMN06272735_8293 [Streptomyces sp. TLI_55]
MVYLTVTRSDVTETYEAAHATGDLRKERVGLAGFALLAVAIAAGRPGEASRSEH